MSKKVLNSFFFFKESENSINKEQKNDKNMIENMEKSKKRVNVINMLQEAVKRKKLNEVNDVGKNENEFQQYLKTFPMHMRSEIANSYKQLQHLEREYEVKKQQQQQEKIEQKSTENTDNELNIFKKSNYQQEVLAWINTSTEQPPSDSDLELIIQHATELALQETSHHELYEQIVWLNKILYRCSGPHACQWHTAAKRILKEVQDELCTLPSGLPFYIPLQKFCDKC